MAHREESSVSDPYLRLTACGPDNVTAEKRLGAYPTIRKRANLKNEAEEIESRLREMIARQTSQPIATREINVACEGPGIRVENHKIGLSAGRSDTSALRITSDGKSAGQVTIIPVTTDGSMVFLVRYRYAAGRWGLEFPSGEVPSDDVTWAEASKQILSQLCGTVVQSVRLLGAVNPHPGIFSGIEAIVLAEGCARRPEHQVEESMLIAGSLDVPQHCLDPLILRGRLDSGTTLSAISLYRAHLAQQT